MSAEAREIRELHAALLRDRAESYWRDAAALVEQDMESMAHAFRAFADELRRLAEQVGP